MSYYLYNNSSYGLAYCTPESGKPLTFDFLRVFDGATGTLTLDIPDAVRVSGNTALSENRFVTAVTVGDLEKGDTRLKLVMTDPSQVIFDGSVKKCDPYDYREKDNKCGDQFGDLRKKADKIEEKYGVKILIGNEVLNLDETMDPYRFVSTESDEADDFSCDETSEGLNELDELLGKYPEGFFEQFKINGKAGLCIALVQYLADKYTDSSFEAAGVTYGYGLWTVIAINANEVGYVLNHEMFHAVEFLVGSKVGPLDEDEWNTLNPEGFEYLADFGEYGEGDTSTDLVYGYDDDPYFARDYGKVTPLEDRATLIEMLFTDAYDDPAEYREYLEDITEKSPHLKAKIDYLADWTKQLFGYVYWEKMLGFEL